MPSMKETWNKEKEDTMAAQQTEAFRSQISHLSQLEKFSLGDMMRMLE